MNCGWPIAPAYEPSHPRRRHVAMIQDAQRGHQFAAEEAGAAAFPGQRRQRLDYVEVAHAGAEAGFQAPDADDDAGVHREPVLHATEQRAVLLERGAAVGDALVGDQQRAVLRPGHGEFGLVAVALQHLLVGLHAGERVVQRRRPRCRRAWPRRACRRGSPGNCPARRRPWTATRPSGSGDSACCMSATKPRAGAINPANATRHGARSWVVARADIPFHPALPSDPPQDWSG